MKENAKIKSSILAVAAVMAVGGAAFMGANTVSAQTTGDSIVERVANTFGLNQDEVQAVFDEVKDEHQADRAAEVDERLEEKVADGTITSEQKTLIQEKMEELREQREANRDSDMTREERQEQMEQTREELEQWADDNSIPVEELMPFGGEGKHGKGGGGFGQRPF